MSVATRKPLQATLVSLCVLLLAALAFASAPALAGKIHLYSTTFGSEGPGAGQLREPSGVAVNDTTHDVYVVDRGNNRIDEFEADGTFMRAWGWGVAGGSLGLETCGPDALTATCQAGTSGEGAGQLDSSEAIAIDNSGSASDPSNGDVYVTNTADNAIEKFSATGEYKGQVPGTFKTLLGVAVDPKGTLWVKQDGPGELLEVDSYSDALNNQLVSSVTLSHTQEVSIVDEGGFDPGLAVDSEDDLYLTYGHAEEDKVVKINSAGEVLALEGKTGVAGRELGGRSPKAGIAVDPANDDVYLDGISAVREFTADGSPIEKFEEHLTGGSGIAVTSAGTVYVTEAAGDRVVAYAEVPVPGVETGEPSNLQTEGSVTLNGTVNPEGLPVEACKFEYVPDTVFKQPATNEVQTLTVLEPSREVELALEINGVTEEFEIPEEVAVREAKEVQAIIEALPIVGPGNVSVKGATGGPYTIEFIGKLAHTPIPELTRSSGSHITVAIVTEGGNGGWGPATSAPCETEGGGSIGSGDAPVAVHANLTGLAPGTLYDYRLDAKNINNTTGESQTPTALFAAPTLPVIAGESFSDVGSTSAQVGAQIDPGGAPTSYRVEYGTSTSYGSSTVPVSAGAGVDPVSVLVQLSGLQPGTAYHVRVLATNLLGTREGHDLTFTTFTPSTAGLPDGRVYEPVSLAPSGEEENAYVPGAGNLGVDNFEKQGINTFLPFQAAADGEAVVYAGQPSPTGGEGKAGEGSGSEFLARRSAGGGWTAENIDLPSKTVGVSSGGYFAFSNDLSVGIFESTVHLAADAPPEGYEDLYTHATAGGVGGEYEPFYTGTPPDRGPQEFGFVGLKGSHVSGYAGGNAGTSAVPAFSDLLFAVNDALRPATPEAVDGGSKEDNLYDSVGGQLYSVNVLPDGVADPNATFGSPAPAVDAEENPPGLSHVISANGSRIFWTALETVAIAYGQYEERPRALYVRENAGTPEAKTVLVAEGGEYWTASSDGSLVFYTKAVAQGDDLYEYKLATATEPATTTDLSVALDPSEPAEVQGVLDASEDGSYVYFVADGDLAAGATKGRPNLYLYHAGEPKPVEFIATLSGGDDGFKWLGIGGGEGHVGDWQAASGYRTAEVTPDGRSLTFMSSASLTGYDNACTNTAQNTPEPCTEVFLYEAGSAEAAGVLRCLSCNRGGEPPALSEILGAQGERVEQGAFLPYSHTNTYQPRLISDDGGRVFFDSAQSLVPQDINGFLDVYEWERDGTGTCRESEGCIYLLSGGTDPGNSYLIDADAEGNNVFIVTRAQLVPQDRGDDENVYDVRVGGVQPAAASPCTGTGCQGAPPPPPIFATPSSVTFNGTGNFPPPAPAVVKKTTKKKAVKCKKGFVKNKKGKCIKKPKKKSKRAKKASHNGRAK